MTGLAAGYAIGFVGDSVRVSPLALLRVLTSGCTTVRARLRIREPGLCFYGSHSHFCGSAGAVWVRTTILFAL
jgi:hypothetical protein